MKTIHEGSSFFCLRSGFRSWILESDEDEREHEEMKMKEQNCYLHCLSPTEEQEQRNCLKRNCSLVMIREKRREYMRVS